MHALPDLPYAYNALEPHIDAATMELHHGKHHAAYVAKLNEALEQAPEWKEKTIEELIRAIDALPAGMRGAARNHGGGHYNHSLFWQMMRPGGGEPGTAMRARLGAAFGSLDEFKNQFTQSALGIFGSGWAWLAQDAKGELRITTTPNQDTPLAQGLAPLLGVDVWEHAYYLAYNNRRADYIAAWWNVVNWDFVAQRLAA
jgi:Fe-Mn family superoxide dismutase